jgi:peptide-methionine (R)-S-oxide reductase
MQFNFKWMLFCCVLVIACDTNSQNSSKKTHTMSDSIKVEKTEEEWRQQLTPLQYEVLRNKGTERPFTGKYYLHNEKGIYTCAACGAELFDSNAKFDAGCGWPSFYDVFDSSKVVHTKDTSHGMIRTEITCAKCGGHLGHVFDDGPLPTGLRYCINSVSIEFKK